MEWVKEFYEKQEKWTRCYTAPISEYHIDRVKEIEKILGSTSLKILELGCGGGQFAVAAATRGHKVVAVELNKDFVDYGKELAESESTNVNYIAGSFYDVTIEENFDAVCYFDGFGIGTDADQRVLLKRISNWLKPNGKAFIDIYTPWYWAYASGQKSIFKTLERCYDFEPYECRMIDKWWPKENESQAVKQSLRCYSPADLKMLIDPTDLMIESIQPGGAMDYEKMVFVEKAPLAKAMNYLAVLKKSA